MSRVRATADGRGPGQRESIKWVSRRPNRPHPGQPGERAIAAGQELGRERVVEDAVMPASRLEGAEERNLFRGAAGPVLHIRMLMNERPFF